MFNPYAYALIGYAIFSLVMTCVTPRAWFWIGLGGASFVASSLYWDYGDRQYHPIFTFTCDALFCLALHLWAKERWELGIFLFFLTSVFASLLKIGGFIPNNTVYASLLELCNWAALFWISGIGLMDLINRYEDSFLRGLHSSLHSARHSL